MTEGLEYGYAVGEDTMWCLRLAGRSRMLCGRHVGFVPVEQPASPAVVHNGCLDVLYGLAPPGSEAEAPTGACPACGGPAPVAGGRVEPHGEFRQCGGEAVESEVPCTGVNMAPKRGGR